MLFNDFICNMYNRWYLLLFGGCGPVILIIILFEENQIINVFLMR